MKLRNPCLVPLVLAAFLTATSKALAQSEGPPTSYEAASQEIMETIRAYHYDPAELDQDDYRAIEAQMIALGKDARDDEAFLAGFREIWRNGPFSHVNLSTAQGSVEALVTYFDTMNVGPEAVQFELHGDIAVLTVNTMMGGDTIEAISAAFAEIEAVSPSKLIIDLRANEGGAFAIRPLVGHLLSAPYDAGIFASQSWNRENANTPTRSDANGVEPWTGWSVRAFWHDVQEQGLVRVQFTPIAPVYDGPVYVLTSTRTASAAELSTDALQGSGRAEIIGERTAGEMLSQRPYDINGKFHLFLPIADYFSFSTGRIEGRGIEPNIVVPSTDALEVALSK